jgi:hypothetical protein
MITFNKIIKLIKVKEGYGHTKSTDEKTVSVCGAVNMPSLSLRAKVEDTGRQIDLSVQIWQRDFEKGSFTHAEYGGIRYRIDSVTTGASDLLVKLSLVRG